LIDKTKQVLSEVLTDTKETIIDRYQKNKQLANTIVFFLAVLFILLCTLFLPTSTDTVTITTGPDSAVISTTKTSVEHGWQDVFSLYIKIVGGLAVLFAGYIGWKRIEVSQEGQITERFTRAIEQLGSDKLAIRLGGLYAFQRIEIDSPKDRLNIFKILLAYLHECADSSKFIYEEAPLEVITTLEIIGKINGKFNRSAEDIWYDISSLNLKNMIIHSIDLSLISFFGVDFTGSSFICCNMEGCSFHGCDLSNVSFSSTFLNKVYFHNSNGKESSFDLCNMKDIRVINTDF